jgi:hypothetical protein
LRFETFYGLFQVCFDHSHYSLALTVATCQHRRCRLLSAASAVHTDHPKRRKVVSAWPFQGLFCMPAGSPLQATAPRSERPRRMHALTCLGLESAGLNNCRSSWQSEIVDVFISPTRVRIPLAPFSRSRPPFPSPFSRYSAVLFPNRILIRLFFLQYPNA